MRFATSLHSAGPPAHDRSAWTAAAALFALLLALYLFTYGGVLHSIDELSALATSESIARYGRFDTDQIAWSQHWGEQTQGHWGTDGHLYSKKGLGFSLLAAPLFRIGLAVPELGGARAALLLNPLLTALTGALVLLFVRRLGYSARAALATGLLYGTATLAWPYTRDFFSEPAAALCLFGGALALLAFAQSGRRGWAALAGVTLGYAVTVRVPNAALLPLFGAYFGWTVWRRCLAGETRSWRAVLIDALACAGPLTVALALLGWANLLRFGSPLDSGYVAGEDFSTPPLVGLYGLLLSPGKGFFWYQPLLLAALPGLALLWRRARAEALLCGGVFAGNVALYAAWYVWWGGWAWGPRFLVPTAPFLAVALAPVLGWAATRAWRLVSLALLAALSVAVQALGVAVSYYTYLRAVTVPEPTVLFDPAWSPLLGHARLLFASAPDFAWVRTGDWAAAVAALALLGAAALAAWRRPRRRIARAFTAAILPAALGVALLATPPAGADPALALDMDAASVLARIGAHLRAGDVVLAEVRADAPSHFEQAQFWMNHYRGAAPYYFPLRGEPADSPPGRLLDGVVSEAERVWLALDRTPPADPNSAIEWELAERLFPVSGEWLSQRERLALFEAPWTDEPEVAREPAVLLGGKVELVEFALAARGGADTAAPDRLSPGDALQLTLGWRAAAPVGEDLTVFVQVVDARGRVRAQVDRAPGDGFRPTSGWPPGERVTDRYHLALPPDAEPGAHRLICGMYRSGTLERLTLAGGGDYVELAVLTVR